VHYSLLFSLFVRMLAKRLAGKTTVFMISIASKGFPYRDQIEEIFIVVV